MQNQMKWIKVSTVITFKTFLKKESKLKKLNTWIWNWQVTQNLVLYWIKLDVLWYIHVAGQITREKKE